MHIIDFVEVDNDRRLNPIEDGCNLYCNVNIGQSRANLSLDLLDQLPRTVSTLVIGPIVSRSRDPIRPVSCSACVPSWGEAAPTLFYLRLKS